MRIPKLSLAAALAALPFLAPAAWAQAPPGYYAPVDSSSPGALRSTLHAVIDDHQRFPYTASSTDTWDILELAEQDPLNAGRIVTVYSDASFPKQGGGNSFYNREHLWPTSLGFPDDGSDNYPFTDCHMLRLADPGYNSARGNKPFRYCDPGCQEWPVAGGPTGTYPGLSNWTSGFGTSGTWEAWAERKGDVARAILYADVRYEGGLHGATGFAEPDLIATNDTTLIAASSTGNNLSVAYMGLLDVLLEWHAADPVDLREQNRNDVVFAFQGNRNPFIDHPEWVELLFQPPAPTDDPWINEFHYDNVGADVAEFVEVAGPAGLDLGGWRVVAYNGSDGAEYTTLDLTGVLPDQGGCLGTLSFPVNSLQNGSPDGLALVDPLDRVVEFLSYEGTLVATDGPAFGLTSSDVGVAESSVTPIGQSLQRIGSGTAATAFAWSGPAVATAGAPNAGQTFADACGGGGLPAPPDGLGGVSCGGVVKLAWNASADPAVTGYRVWRSATPGFGFAPLFAQPIAATEYVDTGAGAGATLYYAVTAVAPAGESALSPELALTVQGGGSATAPWVNEFHYDNASTDTGEFVEVAGPSGLSLQGWSLVGYNGANGDPYTTVPLAGALPDGPGCVGALDFPFTGLQNGSPDGLALVDPQGAVVEFWSYEGTLVAASGPAAGLSSVDVGVEESSSTPVGQSLQRTGSGAQAGAFPTWTGPAAETRGAVNLGQTFAGGCAGDFVAVGCGVNPSDSLVLLDGVPAIGSTLTFGLDNPLGTQAPGSLTFLVLSAAPDPLAPCGTLLPGYGMGGAFGELLVSLAPSALLGPILSGPAWSGPGQPAPIAVGVPVACGLAGADLWLQGVLVDPLGPTTFGLTEGRRLSIAP